MPRVPAAGRDRKQGLRDAPHARTPLDRDLRPGSSTRRPQSSPGAGLVAVSVLSLGLGIGLNLTLYAGVTTIFRHQPTMTDPARVVGIEPGNGRQFSYQNYRDLRDSGTFSGVVGFRISAMNRRVGDELERLSVLVVTDNFFESLGIRARLGRTFSAGRSRAGTFPASGCPRSSLLECPLRRRSQRDRPDDDPRWRAVHGDRRPAGGLPSRSPASWRRVRTCRSAR